MIASQSSLRKIGGFSNSLAAAILPIFFENVRVDLWLSSYFFLVPHLWFGSMSPSGVLGPYQHPIQLALMHQILFGRRTPRET
jgi:hypothetical protein